MTGYLPSGPIRRCSAKNKIHILKLGWLFSTLFFPLSTDPTWQRSATLNLSQRGTPTTPSHPFFTVCFPLVLSLYLLSFFLSPSPSLSLSLSLYEDLTFFPLGSHCALTGAFVTRHPLLWQNIACSLPPSFSLFHTLAIFDSLFFRPPQYCAFLKNLIAVSLAVPSLPDSFPFFPSLSLPSRSPVLSHASSLCLCLCLAKQLEPRDLFSVGSTLNFHCEPVAQKKWNIRLKNNKLQSTMLCSCPCVSWRRKTSHIPYAVQDLSQSKALVL